jgi:amino acid adenylation domain-containing protein
MENQLTARDKFLERDIYPLSFCQRRLWFINQLEPGNTSYNLVNATKIKGNVDIDVLEKIINEVIGRHAALRTVFKKINGEPFQYILPELPVRINVIDFKTATAPTEESLFEELVSRECKHIFNLEEGPLLRIRLLKTSQNECTFILNMHHIISDGWSIRLFMEELATLYTAAINGMPSPLKPLPVSYADYTMMQIEKYEKGLLEDDLAYWTQKLRDSVGYLPLPTDFPRPQVQKYHGGTLSFEIGSSMKKLLGQLAKQEKTTVYMILLACFNLILHRYTMEKDILVGTPIAGRNSLEIEPIIGYFSNTLVIRTTIQEEQSFKQLLRDVSATILEAYEHQGLPFEKLIEALNPERTLVNSPLFQVFFSFQNNKSMPECINGLTFEPVTIKKDTSKFDMSFEIDEYEDKLLINIEYNTDLFAAKTIERFFAHYYRIVENIIINTDIKVSDIDIMDAGEKSMLFSLNNTRVHYPKNKCIHELIEEQVEKTGRKTAIRYNRESISYRELNDRSNKIAAFLSGQGVKPGERIGICMDSGPQMVIGILGVWKAGCGYVPLDPLYPEKRIRYIVNDSSLKMILTHNSALNAFNMEGVQIYDFSDCSLRQDCAVAETPAPASSDSIAYLLYTSGSTGDPKGVIICHRAVVNFLCSMMDKPGIKEDDQLLSVTSFTFDISILEMFLPLVCGGSVIFLDSSERQDASRLKERIEFYKPTIMQATPATWRMLINAGWQGDKGRLKLLCGGEALERKLADQLLKRGYELWNMYGPTETTVWSLIHKVSFEGGDVPIGRPIANTCVYILDKYLNPVPQGIAGDLYIGGEGLAVGYNNMPDETREKFIGNIKVKEDRLYRTGDKGKLGQDGLVYYLGRGDFQMKIRGYRVEAKEIEGKIRAYKGVDDCIAASICDETGENSLVVYIKIEIGSKDAFDENNLYKYLSEELPFYMIPSNIIVMDKFPLTAHGKIDRKNCRFHLKKRMIW